ncbi:MAG: SDR family NAD(P)-dependent oxidoreductase [Candidatus Heimdallarchaeota archaeon]|nr:SDR family NAD(P)-dependent oxidoreductase [Candidatus Heimdallarchaeota archaeon]
MSSKEIQKAILITGANTGIGRKTLNLISNKGYFVYAGVRSDQAIEELESLPNVKPIRLDVTKENQVKEAIKLIKKEGRGLYGLVNNAGIADVGPITTASMDI